MGKITWSKESVNFVIENYDKLTTREISLKLNKTISSIHCKINLLANIGKIKKENYTPWPEIKYGKILIKQIKDSFVKYGLDYASNRFNIDKKEILKFSMAYGWKRIKRKNYSITYQFNSDILKNPTKEFAYFLGYFWADGHISKNKSIVALETNFSDLSYLMIHFNTFSEWYSATRQRKPRKRLQAKPKKILSLRQYNREFYDYLFNLGYATKSGGSASYVLNSLPENLKKYWWRGFFDGDGHISFSFDGKLARKSGQLSLTSCFKQNWDFAIDLFRKIGLEKFEVQRKDGKENGCASVLMIRDFDQVKLFLDYIYEKNFDGIGLSRKYFYYYKMNEYIRLKNKYMIGFFGVGDKK